VKSVVLDASAALQLILPDTAAAFDAAGSLFTDLAAEHIKAHVPVIFFNEVAAVIARAVRGKRITPPQAESFLTVMAATPLVLQIEVLSAGRLVRTRHALGMPGGRWRLSRSRARSGRADRHHRPWPDDGRAVEQGEAVLGGHDGLTSRSPKAGHRVGESGRPCAARYWDCNSPSS
jgi:hypothetical protein